MKIKQSELLTTIPLCGQIFCPESPAPSSSPIFSSWLCKVTLVMPAPAAVLLLFHHLYPSEIRLSKTRRNFLRSVSGSLSLAMAISSQMREAMVGLGSSARAMIGARVVTPIRSVAVALREF